MDFLALLKKDYEKIDPFYRNVFFILFLLMNAVYCLYTIHFIMGDHAAGYFVVPLEYEAVWWSGRFFAAVPLLITGGNIVPVLNSVLAFSGYIAGGIMLCALWEVPKVKAYYILIVSFLLFVPFTMTWMWYTEAVFPVFMIPFYIGGAFLLVRRAGKLAIALAALLIGIALATYHVAINTIAIVFLATLVSDLYSTGFHFTRKNRLYYQRLVTACVLGGVLALLSYLYLKLGGYLKDFYTLETRSVMDMLRSVPQMTYYAFKQYFFSEPYLSAGYKFFLFLAWVAALLAVVLRLKKTGRSFFRIAAITVLFLLLLLSTQIANLLTVHELWHKPRIAFFGLVYVSLFAFAMLCRSRSKWLNNLGAILLAGFFLVNIYNDLLVQKAWKSAADVDIHRLQRLVGHIEALPGFDVAQNYKLYVCGEFPNLGTTYYTKPDKVAYLDVVTELHGIGIFPMWNFGLSFARVEPQLYFAFGRGSRADISDDFAGLVKRIAELTDEERAAFQQAFAKAGSWPQRSSVVLVGNEVIVFLNKYCLEEARRMVGG